MITATIGKIFLEAYNKKNHTDYDAKSFFVEVYHPLFFGSSKYLQWVQNSPFVQGLESSNSGEFGVVEVIKDANGKTKHFKNKEDLSSFLQSKYKDSMDEILEIKDSKLEQIKILWKITTRQTERMLSAFLKKVEEKDIPDASIAPGYPASEEDGFAPTSGQVTNMDLPTTKDEIYLSWIGSSFGIGMKGGYLLIPEPAILLDLFDGWQLYRKILTENTKLKGNQINAWNGQWLIHRYDKGNFYPENPMVGFDIDSLFEKTKEGINVSIQSWTKIFIKMAQHFDSVKILGYFYGFDPKSKLPITLGFIPINLESIKRPVDLYKKFFGMRNNEGNAAEKMWGTEYGLKESCKLGMIGIKAMQPKGLIQYMKPDNGKDVKIPKYDDKQLINFHTYQIWLLAMLNNEELWTKSKEFASALHSFIKQDKSIRKQRGNAVDNVLSATTKKNFISSLKNLIPDVEDVSCFEEIAKIVHLMPSDNVAYFLTLIRFHYAIINK